MAASVEGFKRQAEEYASEIAAATFHEIMTRNPADVMYGSKDAAKDGRPPSAIDTIANAIKSNTKKDK